MGYLGYMTSKRAENRCRTGLFCRSFPINGSFVLFNLVASLLKQLFGLVVLLRLSSLLSSALFLLERETYQKRSSMQAPVVEPAMEKEDLENDYGRSVDGKERRHSRWSIGEKTGDNRQDSFGDEAEGDVKCTDSNSTFVEIMLNLMQIQDPGVVVSFRQPHYDSKF
jgi:hypothetical protein